MDRIRHLKMLQDMSVRLRRLAAGESAKLSAELLEIARGIEADARILEAELIAAGILVAPRAAPSQAQEAQGNGSGSRS